MISALIFDIGGVLAHDVWENLLLDEKKGIASSFNLDREKVFSVGQELWEEFAYRDYSGEQGWKSLEEAYWHLFIERFNLLEPVEYFIQLTDEFITPVQGMAKLLKRLQSNGVDLAICSNNNAFWSKRQLEQLEFGQYFDSSKIILSNRIGSSKSSPGFEMFQAAIKALGVDKDSCMFIDDRQNSIEWSLKFGIAGIYFPAHSKYGAHYLEALLKSLELV